MTDFSVADDTLDVSTIIENFHDVLGPATQEGDKTLIDFGDGNSALLLNNIEVDTLSSRNFVLR